MWTKYKQELDTNISFWYNILKLSLYYTVYYSVEGTNVLPVLI